MSFAVGFIAALVAFEVAILFEKVDSRAWFPRHSLAVAIALIFGAATQITVAFVRFLAG